MEAVQRQTHLSGNDHGPTRSNLMFKVCHLPHFLLISIVPLRSFRLYTVFKAHVASIP